MLALYSGTGYSVSVSAARPVCLTLFCRRKTGRHKAMTDEERRRCCNTEKVAAVSCHGARNCCVPARVGRATAKKKIGTCSAEDEYLCTMLAYYQGLYCVVGGLEIACMSWCVFDCISNVSGKGFGNPQS